MTNPPADSRSGLPDPTGSRRPDDGILRSPEFNIAIFSFLLHFIWEFLQAPAYAGMAELNHWEGIKTCTSATIGDVGIALACFWATSLMSRSRGWLASPASWQWLVFIAIGLVITIGLEYYYTEISGRWAYSDSMPLAPPFGTGLTPFLQWLFIPPLVIWFAQRQTGCR